MITELAELLASKRVLVCCGAGGVGKTTVAASLGLAAARAGRRTLVLTIDPARRLAEALGLEESGTAPVTLSPAAHETAGIQPPGSLSAWMLNPRVVFERLVTQLSPSPEAARRVLETALFRHLSELVAGMQEYTAAEALYELSNEGRYDLIVLDTPPSRNALDFLDAPGRLSRFLDERILALFLPDARRFILLRKAADRVADILSRIFGEAFFHEMQDFLSAARGLFGPMRRHSDEVRRLLGSRSAAFLLVTTSEEAALVEARFFRAKLASHRLPFAGFVLNRSWATAGQGNMPLESPEARDATGSLRAGLAKLESLARLERAWGARDRTFLDALKAELSADGLAVAAPYLSESLENVSDLAALAQALTSG